MSWSELHIDALAEMMNVGVGHAASILSEMIDHKIDLSVPSVSFVGRDDLASFLADEMPSGVVSIQQDFTGEFCGAVSLFFLEDSSAPLVRMLLHDELTAEEVLELEAEALSELGNIIINASLGTLANGLNTTLAIDLPKFTKGPLISDVLESGESADQDSILVRIFLNSQPTGIGGLIVLFMDGGAQAKLREKLDEMLAEAC